MANIQLKIKKNNGEYLILNKKWIDNLETLSQSTSDPSTIQYGCLGNSGSAKLRDIDGSIRNLIEIGELNNSNVPVQIVVNGNVIQNHIISDSDYNIKDKTFSITMKNSISNWDSLIFKNRKLTEEITLLALLKETINTYLGYSYEQIESMIDPFAKSEMNFIKIKYPYLKEGNFREAVDKLCQTSQLNIFLDENDVPRIIMNRPYTTSNKLIHISNNAKITNLNRNIILKNKYNKISTNFDSFFLDEPKDVFSTNVIVYNDNDVFVAQDYSINKEFKDIGLSTVGTNPSGTGNMSILVNNPKKLRPDIQNIAPKFIADNISCKITKTFDDGLTQESSLTKLSSQYWTPAPLDEIFSIQYTTDGINLDSFNFNVTVRWANPSGQLITKKKVASFRISLYASKYSFTNNKITYGDGDNEFSLESNELFQDTTKYISTPIYEEIANNILSDYSTGIANATIDIFCTDLYYSDNTLAKDWDKGEIINVGDIIYFDNDTYANGSQRYWRVTGRTFKYSGAPTLRLELQECKKIN